MDSTVILKKKGLNLKWAQCNLVIMNCIIQCNLSVCHQVSEDL